MHNNLFTIDKNMYMSEAGNRSTRSHPFQYHRPNAYTDGLKFSFVPRIIATWNGLTTEAVSAETVDGFNGFNKNSSSRFKIIKRHETELKWIKLLQTPFPLGFNDNIYHEGNISKMHDFDGFSLLEIRKRKSRSHGIRKKGNGKRKKTSCKEIKCFT